MAAPFSNKLGLSLREEWRQMHGADERRPRLELGDGGHDRRDGVVGDAAHLEGERVDIFLRFSSDPGQKVRHSSKPGRN